MTSTKQLINRINTCTTRDELENVQDAMLAWIEFINSREDAVLDCMAECFATHGTGDESEDDRSIAICQRYEAQVERLSIAVEDAYEAQWEATDWLPEEE